LDFVINFLQFIWDYYLIFELYVGIAHQNPDMVGIAHPTNTDVCSIFKYDFYSF